MAAAKAHFLPDPRDPVTIQRGICAHDRESERLGLCNQHAVERVLVVARQRTCSNRMIDGNRQASEAFLKQQARQIGNQFLSVKLAQVGLNGELPSNAGGNIYPILRAFQSDASLARKLRRAGEPPKHNVSVDDERSFETEIAQLFIG